MPSVCVSKSEPLARQGAGLINGWSQVRRGTQSGKELGAAFPQPGPSPLTLACTVLSGLVSSQPCLLRNARRGRWKEGLRGELADRLDGLGTTAQARGWVYPALLLLLVLCQVDLYMLSLLDFRVLKLYPIPPPFVFPAECVTVLGTQGVGSVYRFGSFFPPL